MSNELLFIITTIGIFGFIRFCFSQGRRWLQAAIVINLILISVFGAKLISVFGLVTNAGNIFYAAVFFTGQLLVEHYGQEEGRRAVWLGLASVAFFVIVGQLTVQYISTADSAEVSAAIDTLFKFTPRLALASMLAYVCAQSLNIAVYGYLRAMRKPKIWVRSLCASAAGQAVDSFVFFSVAFAGVIPHYTLVQAMATGFIVKLSLGILSVPFLYSSYAVKTQREILEQEAEAILLGIGDGLVITDRNGNIILVNKAFETMLGWKVSEVTGKQMTDVLKRYDEAGNRISFKERILTRVLRGEKVETAMTNHTYFARKDGSKFPVRIIVTPVLIDNVIMGAVEVFQDVTREKEIENLRADFLALAAHQLRTPLSGTRWIIETLKDGILGQTNEKQKKYLLSLSQINNRMIELVSDMLNVLRLESGNKTPVVKETFSTKKIFDEIVITMQAAAKEKGVVLEISSNSNTPLSVTTDFKLAKSIVAAFGSNAINYTPAGGKVTLGQEEKDNEIIISVQDEGIGIPRDEQHRIFERFYRASNAKLVKTDGTGLGLYIAFVVAKKIGAKISFESTQNKGSTFFLHIPKPT